MSGIINNGHFGSKNILIVYYLSLIFFLPQLSIHSFVTDSIWIIAVYMLIFVIVRVYAAEGIGGIDKIRRSYLRAYRLIGSILIAGPVIALILIIKPKCDVGIFYTNLVDITNLVLIFSVMPFAMIGVNVAESIYINTLIDEGCVKLSKNKLKQINNENQSTKVKNLINCKLKSSRMRNCLIKC